MEGTRRYVRLGPRHGQRRQLGPYLGRPAQGAAHCGLMPRQQLLQRNAQRARSSGGWSTGLLSRGSLVRVQPGAPLWPDFARARICTAESGDILRLTVTGRNLPTEILFAVSGPFLSGREPRILIAIHSLSVGADQWHRRDRWPHCWARVCSRRTSTIRRSIRCIATSSPITASSRCRAAWAIPIARPTLHTASHWLDVSRIVAHGPIARSPSSA